MTSPDKTNLPKKSDVINKKLDDSPLIPGQPYLPYKIFNGVFIPESLYSDRKISDGAKLLFGRLLRYSGENGRCHPKLESLAKERGVDIATVKRWLKELTGLVKTKKRGPHPAEFIFLWHPCLKTSLRSSAKARCVEPEDSAEMRRIEEKTAHSCTEDSANLSGIDSAFLSSAYKEGRESVLRESKRERAALPESTGVVEKPVKAEIPPPAILSFPKPKTEDQNLSQEKPESESPDVQSIRNALQEHGIKILNPTHPQEILNAVVCLQGNAEAAVAFIAWKVERAKQRPETSRLILKMLADGDYAQFLASPQWQAVRPRERKPEPKTCLKCYGNGRSFDAEADERGWCSCETGQRLKEANHPEFFKAKGRCSSTHCRARLFYRTKSQPDFTRCAFCITPEGYTPQKIEEIAREKQADAPVEDCRVCHNSGYFMGQEKSGQGPKVWEWCACKSGEIVKAETPGRVEKLNDDSRYWWEADRERRSAQRTAVSAFLSSPTEAVNDVPF